jgi:hypothetical protein
LSKGVGSFHTTPNADFAELASDEQIATTLAALNANHIQTVVVDTAEEARQYVLGLLPEGAEVHTGRRAHSTRSG